MDSRIEDIVGLLVKKKTMTVMMIDTLMGEEYLDMESSILQVQEASANPNV
jgi:hypothetical protein